MADHRSRPEVQPRRQDTLMGGDLRRSLLGYGYPLKYAQQIFLRRHESVGFGASRASFVIPNGFGYMARSDYRLRICEQFLTNNFLLLGESEGA